MLGFQVLDNPQSAPAPSPVQFILPPELEAREPAEMNSDPPADNLAATPRIAGSTISTIELAVCALSR